MKPDCMRQLDLAGMPVTREPEAERDIALGQWMTPLWAAETLVEEHLGELRPGDAVLEPSCGTGAFLAALPKGIPAVGVEIDAGLAAEAKRNTGRTVLVGDFRTIDIPLKPTVIVGNPPFTQATIQGFFNRAWDLLPCEGRVGFVLPCYVFQTASVVCRLGQQWGMRQTMIPRNVFRGLRLPLCFAVLTKGHGKGLVGFALYHETAAVQSLADRYRAIMREGETSMWAGVVRAAMERLGGEGAVQDVYGEIQGYQPTGNPFWKAKVRQTLQRIGERTGPARWAVAALP